MPRNICDLNSWEGERLFEKSEQPKCSNHSHMSVREASEAEGSDLGYFTDNTRRVFVRNSPRRWAIVGITMQMVPIKRQQSTR